MIGALSSVGYGLTDTLPTPETVMVSVLPPLVRLKVKDPVVAVTVPLGLNCRVVEGLNVTSSVLLHGIGPPTFVNVLAHAGGLPESASCATW